MAWALLAKLQVVGTVFKDANGWQSLRPGSVDALPSQPGVFALGNLVRNILLVAGEAGQPLRDAVREALATPAVARQARCIRFALAEDPAEAAQDLLAEYRAAHDGNLPPEQPRRAHLQSAGMRCVPARTALTPRMSGPDQLPRSATAASRRNAALSA